MKKVSFIIIVFMFCVFGFFGEKPFDSTRPYYQPSEILPFDWPTSTPEKQGLEANIFENAFNEAERMPFIFSLLVIRNGFLIGEQYFNGQDRYQSTVIASASKSFLSALVGIALREKHLVSLDQKMADFFPEYITSDLDPKKYEITIRHLLQMRAGYPYDSTTDHWDQWTSSNDWMKFAFDVDLAADPGQIWNYSTSSTHLLSGILTKATGMSTLDFANKYLFERLQISPTYWHRDPLGYYTGGWDMVFFPRDIARFGMLYLNKGVVDGKQIVPAEWVEESIRRYSTTYYDFEFIEETGYGYLWWLGDVLGYDYYFANGHGGQFIIIIPGLDMVVVTTADAYGDWSNAWNQIIQILKLITHHILSPVISVLGPPPYPPTDLNGMKVENRSLTQVESVNVLTWQPSPRNEGVDIAGYRIYRVNQEEGRVFVDETDTNSLEFWHRYYGGSSELTYAVSSVTADNKESVAAFVTIHQ